jgi:Rrf2 family protein
MRFSTSTEYAVHGLIYLANVGSGGRALTRDVGTATGVPEGYLRKVFQQLSRSGLVDSRKGAHGGFRLARDPALISLKDVVESIDGSLPTYTCVRDQRGCRLGESCPVHDAFDQARERMAEVLEATSIQDLTLMLGGRDPVVQWLPVPV